MLTFLIDFMYIFLLSINVNLSTPHTSGMTAIELWMIICIVMVFAALCEYGILLRIASKRNEVRPKSRSQKRIFSLKLENKHERIDQPYGYRKIDNVSLMAFPAIFLLFVMFYCIWVYH